MYDDNVLIIFVKYPKPGAVKTRLARDLGSEAAAAIYRSTAEKVIENTRRGSYRQVIYYADNVAIEQMRRWLDDDHRFISQRGSDLGERMENAFREAFAGGAKNVVVIGSDCPGIDQACIDAAFTALKHADCVIGPANDGGYYLLGLKALPEGFFERIDWSTDKVYTQQCVKAQRAGYVLDVQETRIDIDIEEDLIMISEKAQPGIRLDSSRG